MEMEEVLLQSQEPPLAEEVYPLEQALAASFCAGASSLRQWLQGLARRLSGAFRSLPQRQSCRSSRRSRPATNVFVGLEQSFTGGLLLERRRMALSRMESHSMELRPLNPGPRFRPLPLSRTTRYGSLRLDFESQPTSLCPEGGTSWETLV